MIVKNKIKQHYNDNQLFFFFLDHGKSSPPGMNPGNPLSALEMTRLALFKMYNQAGLPHGPPPGLPPGLGHAGLEMGRAMAEQQARALQAVREAEHRAEKEKEAALAVAAEKQRDREQREQVKLTGHVKSNVKSAFNKRQQSYLFL
jgi:hypothetical protein